MKNKFKMFLKDSIFAIIFSLFVFALVTIFGVKHNGEKDWIIKESDLYLSPGFKCLPIDSMKVTIPNDCFRIMIVVEKSDSNRIILVRDIKEIQ